MTPAEGSHPEVVRVVLGVTDAQGRLRATRQRLRVVDHGTGAAGELAVVGLDPWEADDVVAAEVAAGRLLAAEPNDPDDGPVPEVVVDLYPAADGEVTAAVSAPGNVAPPPVEGTTGERTAGRGTATEGTAADLARRFTRPPTGLADRVLGLLTRDRLAAGGGATLHGAALADGRGRAVVVLAPSGSGKSTLAAHLAAGGLDLLTDEQLGVHAEAGLVSGFTRPVAVKPGGAAYLPEPAATRHAGAATTTLVAAADLGSRHALTGAPALVVLPERGPTVVPGWEVLDPLAAVEALAANNLDLVADPVAGLAAYAWLVGVAAVVRVRYLTSAQGASVVRALFDEPPAVASSGHPSALAVTVAPDAPAEPTPTADAAVRLRPRAGLVTVAGGDGALVFDPASLRLLRCNANGARHWAALPARRWPVPVEARAFLADLVTAGLVEEHWPPSVPDDGSRSLVAVAGGGLEVGPGGVGDHLDPDVVAVLARLAAARASGLAAEAATVVVEARRSGPGHALALRRSLDAHGLVAQVEAAGPRLDASRSGSRRSTSGPGPVVVVPVDRLVDRVAALVAMPRGTRLVVLVRGPVAAPPPPGTRRVLAVLARRHRVRVLAAGGAPTVEVAGALGVDEATVVALPVTAPEVPVAERPGDEEALRAALGATPEHLVVVSVASPATVADVRTLLAVGAAVHRRGDVAVRLVLVGDGPVVAGARTRVDEAGLASVVTVVDRPEVVDGFLLGADAHLLTADGPTGPRRVVAAMHAGLPTVAAGCGPGAALVQAAGTGRVLDRAGPLAPADAVVDVLADLRADPAARRALGERAVAEARAHHGPGALDAVVARLMAP